MRTIRPIRITLKNFLSHKDTVFEFDEEGSYLIIGRNYDSLDKKKSNGSGKTTIMNAILYVFTGKTLNGKRANGVISDWADSSKVKFEFWNDGKKGYILSTRNPNRLVFFDGYEKHQSHSITDLQSQIETYFGFDFELLTKFILVGENERHKFSFLGSDDREKKELLTKLISAEVIDNAQNIVVRRLRKKEEDLIGQESLLGLEIQRKQDLIDQVNSLKNQQSFSNEKLILYKEKVRNKKHLESKIESITKSIEKMQEKNISAIKKLLDKVNELTLLIVKKGDEERKKQIAYEDFSKRRAKTTVCPHCQKEITPEKETLTRKQLKREMFNCAIAIRNLKKDIKNLMNLRTDHLQRIEDIEDDKELKDYAKRKEDLKDLYVKVNMKVEKLKQEKEILEDEKFKRIQEKLKNLTNCKSNIKSVKGTIKELKDKILLYQKYKFYFGKEGFKNYLFGKKLKVIESQVNMYLSDTESGMDIKLSGMTKLKSGKYNQKISESINILGAKKSRRYADLSKGEARIIDLVFIFAFADLLSFKTNFKLRMFDEPFSGLDSGGKRKVIDMFERLPILNYVVTPESKLQDYYSSGRVIQISKEDGISGIQ